MKPNWPLALKRVRADLTDRVFVRRPFSLQLLEIDLEGAFEGIQEAIDDQSYFPQSMYVCDVPKNKFAIRPGSILSLVDQLVYAACLGECYPYIHKELSWSQGKIDFSYRLPPKLDNDVWIRDRITGWKEFREKSLAEIRSGAEYVVVADIASFYDNIDLPTLMSDVRQLGIPDEVAKMLATCLNKWAQIPGRGIPQGCTASDLLAKLYLNGLDRNLSAMTYVHFRYVDDIRIFCSDLKDAKRALLELTRLLRVRGLNLQTAKSEIMRADKAAEEFRELTVVLTGIAERYVSEVVRETGFGDPYMSVGEADAILETNPEEAPIEIIERAYQTYFVDSSDNFNPTLFRFLLNRLAKHEDSYAYPHCLSFLITHPEETAGILNYLQKTVVIQEAVDVLVQHITAGEAVYEYQIYQIFEWLYANVEECSSELLDLVRAETFNEGRAAYVKSFSRALLGKFGIPADLERLMTKYPDYQNERDRWETICCLDRVEKVRRNAFLARAEKEGAMFVRAARFVKGQA